MANLIESVKIDQKHRAVGSRKISSEGGSFTLTSSSAAITAKDIGSNTILTVYVEHTVVNRKDVLPINIHTDLYLDIKQDGNIINSVDHSFNLENADGTPLESTNHEFWYTIGKFHNRQSATLNQFDIEFQLTNSSIAIHDYWIDYSVYLINFD